MDDAKPDAIASQAPDGDFDAYGLFDPDEPNIFEEFGILEPEIDEAAEREADARAEADVAAGRVIPHEDVVKWLESFGTANRLPRPQPWRK